MGLRLLQFIFVAAGCIVLSLIFVSIRVLLGTVSRKRTRRRLSSIAVPESVTFDPTDISRIDMCELVHATRDFSPDLVIGDGGFGLVYKAELSSGLHVAVKRLSADAFQGFREFRAEMETLGKIRHPNIVKMIGYCSAGPDRVLIYELAMNGSLDQWLHPTASESEPLTWETRAKIVKGVARGLAYMHGLETPIIHRDIKASNVLLDEDFESKIADFGLARRMEGSRMHVSTQVAGTMGYMPPEYIHGAAMATKMGDVYSFGVLMLETVTGRRPNFPFAGEDGRETRLVEWAGAMIAQNRHRDIIDPSLASSVYNNPTENEMRRYLGIATMCSSETWKARPTMNDVTLMLDNQCSSC
ncbi:unnamed protein product [Cuscuta campestris]|uniref:non-specific serine/threonine protein kinase n=1 Tax=Cuscuta campestris TaxID=132261 RepID=A0A484NG98_9ASTE|nr:unnamed protein product [Cuscuta campestris]